MSGDDDRVQWLYCSEKFCDQLFARRCPPLTTEDLRCFYLLLKDEFSHYRWPPFEQLMETVKITTPDPTDVVKTCEHYVCMVCCLVFRAWTSFCGHLRATEHLDQAKVIAKTAETTASDGRAARRCPLKDCRTKCANDKRLLDHLRAHPHFLLAVKEVPNELDASVGHACLQCGALFSAKQKATEHAKSCGDKRSTSGAAGALRSTFSSDSASIETTSDNVILLKALRSNKKFVLSCRLENQMKEAVTIRGVEVCSELSNFYLNNNKTADTASQSLKAASDVVAPGKSHVIEFVAQLETYGFYEGSLRIAYESGRSKAVCFLYWTVNLEVISEEHDLLLPSSRFVAKQPEPWIDAPTIPGPLPPRTFSKLEFRIRLKEYFVPQDIRSMAQQNKISEDKRQLSKECYKDKMSRLLHIEEIAKEEAMRMLTVPSASMQKDGQMFLLEVPGIVDGKTEVKVGDTVKLFFLNQSHQPDKTLSYSGTVHRVDRQYLSLQFKRTFCERYTNKAKFRVEFPLDRWQLRTLHRAVERTAANSALMESVLFPTTSEQDINRCQARTPSDMSLKLGKSRVADNPEQLRAVKAIVSGLSSPHPYLIFGPPGTGKTTTVVEAIKQVYLLKPKSRQLICTPQNNAADLIAERLLLEDLPPVDIMRINAFSRKKASISNRKVAEVSNYDSSDAAYMPSEEELFGKRVIVCTLSTSSRFVSADLGRQFFTHIVIDESGQALEPETLIPLTDLLEVSSTKCYGQLVLAGDPKQLGPVLESAIAKRSGLGTSLLERLMDECSLYKKQQTSKAYDSRFVTKLVRNFRSHPDILTIPNELFYDGELEPYAQLTEREKFCSWDVLPRKNFPIIMHGVIGRDHREGENPSYFNIAEAEMVVYYVTKLLRLKTINVKPADIGIISPYAQQASKIRKLLKARLSSMKTANVDDIQTGTAEKFQGQERPVIIISTVRTEKSLGFVSDAKRFNVALTRAKSLLIVVGNPKILSQDVYWKRFIDYCRERGGLRDSHLRSDQADNQDTSGTAVLVD